MLYWKDARASRPLKLQKHLLKKLLLTQNNFQLVFGSGNL